MAAAYAIEPVPLDLIIANERLISRPSRRSDRGAERSAFRALTQALSQDRAAILRRLATLALTMCEAGTAGVSLLEDSPDGEIFRWKVLAGKLAGHEGGATPRNWSPCGSCLDAGKPILYSYPARRFTYFAEIDVPIVEGLVIPFYTDGRAIGTIWIVSHDEVRGFDAEDLRIMTSLAKFAGAALGPVFHPIADETEGQNQHSDQDAIWRGYLGRIARNDHIALDALFHEAHPLVFSIALRILGFAADADEVAGDVFARLWSAGNLYDQQRGSATGWISAVTRNLAFDRLRSRAPEVQSSALLLVECSSTADPEDYWVSARENARLQKALAAVPLEQRRAIELAYFSELSHADIAQKLNEPLGTIKTRIRTGLIQLRVLLAAAK